MALLSLVLRLAFNPTRATAPSSLEEHKLNQIPTTITSALSRFNLHNSTTVYVACPTCSCLYKPVFRSSSPTPKYPAHCTNKPKPWLPVCGQPLLQSTLNGQTSPIRPFVYQHFHDFMASLLSRREINAIIDNPCDKLMKSCHNPPPMNAKDIWDGEFLRTFHGPLPSALFVDRMGEGHLAF